jgi:hypothetical protein
MPLVFANLAHDSLQHGRVDNDFADYRTAQIARIVLVFHAGLELRNGRVRYIVSDGFCTAARVTVLHRGGARRDVDTMVPTHSVI